jgi:hypothetical protein
VGEKRRIQLDIFDGDRSPGDPRAVGFAERLRVMITGPPGPSTVFVLVLGLLEAIGTCAGD